MRVLLVCRRVLRDDVSVDVVRKEMSALLGDRSYTSAAGNVGDQIRNMPPPAAAVARIEEMLAATGPAG